VIVYAPFQDDSSSEFYVHQGGQIVLYYETMPLLCLSHRYLWGPATDELLADETADLVGGGATPGTTDDVAWVLADHQGSVRDLVVYEDDVVTVEKHTVYDAFGNVTSEYLAPGSTADCEFGYTGRLFDSATGLQNNLHRWYDPAVGRWLSADPIGFAGDCGNLYRYCGNSPGNWIDPSGMNAFEDGLRLRQEMGLVRAESITAAREIHVGLRYAEAAAEIGLSVIPGAGESQDFVTAVHPDSTPIERAVAILSLGLSIITLGTSPNFGRAGRLADDLVDGAGDIGRGADDVLEGAGVIGRGGDDLVEGAGDIGHSIGICFVAGTPVLVPARNEMEPCALYAGIIASKDEDTDNNCLLASVILLVGLAGWRLDSSREDRKRRKGQVVIEFDADNDEGEDEPDESARDVVGRRSGDLRSDELAGLPPCDVRGRILEEESAVALARKGGLARKDGRSSATTPFDRPRPTRRSAGLFGKSWLVVCVLLAAFFGGRCFWKLGEEATPASLSAAPVSQCASLGQLASQAIETVRVGQRVVAANPELAGSPRSTLTAVDPSTWRLLRLRAVDTWPDGTVDTIEVETLQPPEWIARHKAAVGAAVPLPLDLVEMGLSDDLRATVVANEPCPTIDDGPGSVVLTTVNHLNPYVLELTLRDGQGHQETVRPTGFHKFYSEARQAWVSAEDFSVGEQTAGKTGPLEVVALSRFPGTHRVYNMTVEGQHVYHVSVLGAAAHNNGCKQMTPDQTAIGDLVDDATLGGRRPLPADDADTILDWADEYDYPGWRAGAGDVNGDHWGPPHIHLPGAGRGGHVPVEPGVQPR